MGNESAEGGQCRCPPAGERLRFLISATVAERESAAFSWADPCSPSHAVVRERSAAGLAPRRGESSCADPPGHVQRADLPAGLRHTASEARRRRCRRTVRSWIPGQPVTDRTVEVVDAGSVSGPVSIRVPKGGLSGSGKGGRVEPVRPRRSRTGIARGAPGGACCREQPQRSACCHRPSVSEEDGGDLTAFKRSSAEAATSLPVGPPAPAPERPRDRCTAAGSRSGRVPAEFRPRRA